MQSYFGLSPDYNIGFVILAVDSVRAPDLNAYADVALGALLNIDQLARAQATADLAGTYASEISGGNSTIVLEPTGSDPGLAITSLVVNSTDWLSEIAKLSHVEPQFLDLRLYPTNLESALGNRTQQALRAVIQDKSALVDAGTPTCISWMTVDEVVKDGFALDEFIFELDGNGKAMAIRSPALKARLLRVI